MILRQMLASFALVLALGACKNMQEQAPPDQLAGTSWQLLTIQSMDDAQGTTRIAEPSHFTLQFGAEGRVSLRLDCNRGSGAWEARPASASSGSLTFGPVASTRMLCPPPAVGEKLARDMGYVRSYRLKDGKLYLSLMADGGIYEWAPLPAP